MSRQWQKMVHHPALWLHHCLRITERDPNPVRPPPTPEGWYVSTRLHAFTIHCSLFLGSRCTAPSTTVNPTSTMASRNPSASSKAILPFAPPFYSAASGSSAEVMMRLSASGTSRQASARNAYKSRSQSAASISWPRKVSFPSCRMF